MKLNKINYYGGTTFLTEPNLGSIIQGSNNFRNELANHNINT